MTNTSLQTVRFNESNLQEDRVSITAFLSVPAGTVSTRHLLLLLPLLLRPQGALHGLSIVSCLASFVISIHGSETSSKIFLAGPSFRRSDTKVVIGGEKGHIVTKINFTQIFAYNRKMRLEIKTLLLTVNLTLKSNASKHLLTDVKLAACERLDAITIRLIETAAMFGIKPPKITSTDNDSTSANQTLDRDRRQLFIGLLFGAAVTGGLSIYTYYQLIQLRKEMDSNLQIVFHRLDAQAAVIYETVEAVKVIKEALESVVKSLSEERLITTAKYKIDNLLDIYNDGVSDLALGLSQAALENGKLSPFLLPYDILADALDIIKEKAREKRNEILELSVYDYPFSVFIDDDTVEIILHVQIIETALIAYVFHALPTLVNSTYVRVADPGRYLLLQGGDSTRGVVLNEADWDECQTHVLTDHLLKSCPNRVLNRDVFSHTCQGRLFSKQPYEDICNIEYVANVNDIYMVGPTSVVAYGSAANNKSWLYCENSTLQDRVEISPGEVIEIPTGCKITMGSSEFKVYNQYHVDANFELALFRHINLTISIEHQDEVLELLRTAPKINAGELRALLQDRRTQLHRHFYQAGGLLVVLLLTIAAITIYCYSYCRYKQRKRLTGCQPAE